MKKSQDRVPAGPYQCEECAAVLETKFARSALEWVWFYHVGTGRVVHFCPMHKNSPRHNKLLRTRHQQQEGE